MVTCQYNSIEYTECKTYACIGNSCGVNMYCGLWRGTWRRPWGKGRNIASCYGRNTSSGKNKRRTTAKWPDYWGSLRAISGTKTKSWPFHYTDPYSQSTSRIGSAILVPTFKTRDIDKTQKAQRRATKKIQEIRNNNYHQRIQDPDHISLDQSRLRGQPMEVYK